MIISLAHDRIRDVAKAAAREQAWTDAQGVRGVPMRVEGSSPVPVVNWDLTAVVEAIDRADVLEWRGGELTVRVRGDHTRVFGISRGDDALVDVVGSGELDWLLQLASQAEQTGAQWAVACPDAGCGLAGDPRPGRREAEHLAGVHDGLHHGGARTARTVLAGSAVEVGAGMGWEVAGPDGTAIYRGLDLELAEEIYHLAPAGAHLLPTQEGTQAVRQAGSPAAVRVADAGVITTGLVTGVVAVLISVLAAGLAWVPVPKEAGAQTERVCYSSGRASDVSTSPDGSMTASGDFPCHYTGGA